MSNKAVPKDPRLEYKGTKKNPDIKIFISHRIDLESETIDNPLFIPVRCGAVFDERSPKEIGNLLGDDTGENISEKRLTYCEVTVQYWAWKNTRADYYGLCHYRRYLNFSKYKYIKDEYGNVLEEEINVDTIRMYGYTESNMRSLIGAYDLIIPERIIISSLPEHPASLLEHWKQAKDLHIADLQILLDVISYMQPAYIESAKKYLYGSDAYFCNLFIMKSDLFYGYCEWLFPILEEIERLIDISAYTVEGQRTVAHLAERLLGIYITYLRGHSPHLKIKELQTVLFRKPEKKKKFLLPAFTQIQQDSIIPIVFASNNVFAPVCGVAISSVIKNADPNYYYDIVVLESDISTHNQKLICSLADGKSYISIRFFNALSLTKDYSLTASEHITTETYYRFLIQDILPNYDKVLYLDGDLVCNRDVAELFRTNIDGYLLAAVHDPDLCGQINLDPATLRYLIQEVKLADPYLYFQAGVLLLNVKEMRKAYSLDQWLGFASKKYRYSDQDVLNRYCQNRVKYINMAWNMVIDCNNYRVPVIIRAANGAVYQEYHKARRDPYIIHFAGFQKPWKQRGVDFEEEFWKYARLTPFYEQFFFDILSNVPNMSNETSGLPPIGVRGALRIYIWKKANKWFPKGTKRRSLMKRFFGWIPRKWGMV